MRYIATIEARMTSSRLPGKPLMEAAGKTMLEYLVERLRAVPSIDGIVLATTVNATDDQLCDAGHTLGIDVFRGSENDVMNRVLGAAESAKADVIVEITGDCPLLDHNIVEQCIRMHKVHNADYVSNVMVRSYPDGMDVQVFNCEVLRRSSKMTSEALDLEHVSLHIRKNPQLFSHIHLVAPPELHWPELGVTLDEQADFDLISEILNNFDGRKKPFTCLEIIDLLNKNPELVDKNLSVVRKGNT